MVLICILKVVYRLNQSVDGAHLVSEVWVGGARGVGGRVGSAGPVVVPGGAGTASLLMQGVGAPPRSSGGSSAVGAGAERRASVPCVLVVTVMMRSRWWSVLRSGFTSAWSPGAGKVLFLSASRSPGHGGVGARLVLGSVEGTTVVAAFSLSGGGGRWNIPVSPPPGAIADLRPAVFHLVGVHVGVVRSEWNKLKKYTLNGKTTLSRGLE